MLIKLTAAESGLAPISRHNLNKVWSRCVQVVFRMSELQLLKCRVRTFQTSTAPSTKTPVEKGRATEMLRWKRDVDRRHITETCDTRCTLQDERLFLFWTSNIPCNTMNVWRPGDCIACANIGWPQHVTADARCRVAGEYDGRVTGNRTNRWRDGRQVTDTARHRCESTWLSSLHITWYQTCNAAECKRSLTGACPPRRDAPVVSFDLYWLIHIDFIYLNLMVMHLPIRS